MDNMLAHYNVLVGNMAEKTQESSWTIVLIYWKQKIYGMK